VLQEQGEIMTGFNEGNTVERMVVETLSGMPSGGRVAEEQAVYGLLGKAAQRTGWKHVPAPQLPRQTSEVFAEQMVREALVRLNPEIAEKPDRADEVLYRLRAIPLAVQTDGLVRAARPSPSGCAARKACPSAPTASTCPCG